MNHPDPAVVLDLIEAFRRSKTMFTGVSLGVFDRLQESPASAAELSAALGTHPGATERLLDACAALGLLAKDDGVYRNTDSSATYLCSTSPHTMSGYIRYSDQALYAMWGNLGDAIREGTPRWSQTFGLDGPIFSSFFRSPEAMRDFVRGMHGFGMLTSPKVAAAFDLSAFGRIADLGGATGHLAIAACERYPGLRGVVFDLERVTAMAREQVALSAACDRIEVKAGDFFEDELPEADLYAVGRILHDWTDAKNRAAAAPHLRSSSRGRRAPGGGKTPGRRRRRSRSGQHAIAEYADRHRGQGTQSGGIYRPVARRGLRGRGRTQNRCGFRRGSGTQGIGGRSGCNPSRVEW
jgi:acetylserotonin N-methyltransferase